MNNGTIGYDAPLCGATQSLCEQPKLAALSNTLERLSIRLANSTCNIGMKINEISRITPANGGLSCEANKSPMPDDFFSHIYSIVGRMEESVEQMERTEKHLSSII